MFDLPIELFILWFAGSAIFIIFGLFSRDPKMGFMVVLGGVMIFPMVALTDNILMGYADTGETTSQTGGEATTLIFDHLLQYDVSTYQGSEQLRDNLNEIVGEYVASNRSALFGLPIDTLIFSINKVGNPPINTLVKAGVWDTSGNLVRQFGSLNVTSLTTQFVQTSFSLPGGQVYVLRVGDLVGIQYTAGTLNNAVQFVRTGNDQFNGTSSHYRVFNGATWTNSTSVDMTAQFTYSQSKQETTITPIITTTDFDREPDKYPFDEMPKALFGLYATVSMAVGSIVFMRRSG